MLKCRRLAGAAGDPLDNLKIVLIAGVIACHATLIYGPGSGWLGYHEGHPGVLETLALGIPGMLGGLFWLGVFFLRIL